jgi:metal-responsive CopG/Arc/MetJ family transcriptional regulator
LWRKVFYAKNEEQGVKIMDVTISIPQSLFRQADKVAIDMGMAQSKLFASAIRAYIEEYRNKNTRGKLKRMCLEFVPDEQILSAGRRNVRELIKNDTW